MVERNGLGYMIDLGVFDRIVNIDSTPAQAEVFDSKGSFFHMLLGAAAGLLPDSWPVLGTSLFGAYELSKVEGGKPFSQIAGAILEFAFGMGIASLILLGRGTR
jgi:hypothetical protein